MADKSVQQRNYLLLGCRLPFLRRWLTTTVWLSQRRSETNLSSCRQQLRRVQAKLQSSLPPLQSVALSIFFFLSLSLPLFLFPSLFHWLVSGLRNFSQRTARRSLGWGSGWGGTQLSHIRPLANGRRPLLILDTFVQSASSKGGTGRRGDSE